MKEEVTGLMVDYLYHLRIHPKTKSRDNIFDEVLFKEQAVSLVL